MQETNEIRENGGSQTKSVMKLVSLVLMVMFFFPLCTVSCSGNTIEVDGLTATFGTEILGRQIDGNILCGLLFLIPLIILIILFVKFFSANHTAIIAGAGALINSIILIVFRYRLTAMAKDAYSTIKFTWSYYGQLILNILLIAMAVIYFQQAMLYKDQPEALSEKGLPEPIQKIIDRNECSIAIIVAAAITCSIIVIVLLIGQHFAL